MAEPKPQERATTLTILCANVTSWRAEVRAWACSHASAIKKQGTSGGVLIFGPAHRNLRKLHSFMDAGKGFTSACLRVRGFDIAVVSIYLLSSVGVHHPTNSSILGELCSFVKSLSCPWICAGDWNSSLQDMKSLALEQVLKAEFLGCNEPTVDNGSELDYILVNKALAPAIQIGASWDVPFGPHCALETTIHLRAVDIPAFELVRFPDRHGVPSQPYSGYSPCHIQELLLEKPATHRLSLKFAGFSKAVETALFGKASGRGWRVKCLRRALVPSSSPALVWTGGPAKFWHRPKTWVDRATQCSISHGWKVPSSWACAPCSSLFELLRP